MSKYKALMSISQTIKKSLIVAKSSYLQGFE